MRLQNLKLNHIVNTVVHFVWNKRLGKMIECTLCLPCWKKVNPKKKNSNDTPKDEGSCDRDEMNALLIGGMVG